MRAVGRIECATAFVAALVAAGILGPSAHAASFDCGRAASAMERLVCGDVALGARDEIMAKLYAGALRTAARTSAEARQQRWLGAAQACKTVACLAEAYDRRNAELLRSKGGAEAATDFFTEEPDGNHGTLSVVGPVHGFATVTLTSTSVGAGGAEAGDVYAAATDAFLDLRNGPATATGKGGCTLTYARLDAKRWTVSQVGPCDLPGSTVFAGTYTR